MGPVVLETHTITAAVIQDQHCIQIYKASNRFQSCFFLAKVCLMCNTHGLNIIHCSEMDVMGIDVQSH